MTNFTHVQTQVCTNFLGESEKYKDSGVKIYPGIHVGMVDGTGLAVTRD